MRITEATIASAAIRNIIQSRDRLDRLQTQIASGYKINRPADDPIATQQIMNSSSQLADSAQYVTNIKNGGLLLQTTDLALQGITEYLQKAKDFGYSVANGTQDTTLRNDALRNLQQIKEQIIQLANTEYNGKYILGGFKNDTSPFDANGNYSGTMLISGNTTTGSQLVDNIDTTGLAVGMAISGPGIPADTTITAITGSGPGSSLTLSRNATANGTAASLVVDPTTVRTVSGTTTVGSDLVTGISNTGLLPGMTVTGPGIPPGTTVLAVPAAAPAAADTLQLSAAVVATIPPTVPPVSLTFVGNFSPMDGEIAVEIDKGITVAVNLSGRELLRGLSQQPTGAAVQSGIDIFRTLDNLIQAISNDDRQAIMAELPNLNRAYEQVQAGRSELTGRQLRLQNTEKMHEAMQTNLKNVVGSIQNIDYAKTITELNLQQTAFEATLSATARISQLSLLDYLK